MTTALIGLGVAIGSGIFRTPGIVAAELGSPAWLIGAWIVGGLFILVSSLVSAELATRFPEAGGEYVYLREAYGGLVAFCFGWGYTVFIVGGGAATIAAASGEALAELLDFDVSWAPMLGASALVVITVLNAFGLKVGAGVQNVLTATKIAALLLVAGVAFVRGGSDTDWTQPLTISADKSLAAALVAGVLPVLWAYEGTTDSIKMAEEMTDARRDIPRALLSSALAITALYVIVNLAFLAVMTPIEMGGSRFVASDLMAAIFGRFGRRMMALLSLLVFLGSLSATILATVRVTFALARDRLAPPALAKMSNAQAPVRALCLVGAIAMMFTLARGFQQILNIYFLAAAILFGLSYASLIVFRIRDRKRGETFPAHVFRCPGGVWLALILIAFEIFLAVRIVLDDADSRYPLVLFVVLAVVYAVWKRLARFASA